MDEERAKDVLWGALYSNRPGSGRIGRHSEKRTSRGKGSMNRALWGFGS